MRKILDLSLRLFMVCALAALALGFVDALVKNRIEEQERKRKATAAERVLEPVGAVPEESPELTEYLRDSFPDLIGVFRGVGEGGATAGYAFVLKSKGYNFITMAVGVDLEGRVLGLDFITNEETPGLGAKALEDEGYLSQFEGKGPERLTLKVDVDAYTSATYTSKGVTNGVNMALDMWREIERRGE
jgi:electron transport complex protein RnfG